MKFEQIKPGMTLADLEDVDREFEAESYYLIFKKDNQLITLIEISEGDAEGEWFYSIRKINEELWGYRGWDEIDAVPKSRFFDTLFTEIKYLGHIH